MSDFYLKIGNTNLALWDGRTKPKILPSQIRSLNQLVRKLKSDDRLFVASVVPQLTQILRGLRKKNTRFLSVHDIPLQLRYKKGLGIDRALNLYEAAHAYKGENVVIVDFGTAMTVDFLSKNSRHLGGWIAPGLKLLREALHTGTAQLPNLKSKPQSRLKLGASTHGSIKFGTQAMALGLVREARAEAQRKWGEEYRILATGGGAQQMPRLQSKPMLSFQAMKRLCTKMKPSRNALHQ